MADKNKGAGRATRAGGGRSIASMVIALAVLLALLYLVPDSLGLVPYAGDLLDTGGTNAVLRTCAGVAVVAFAVVRGLLLRRGTPAGNANPDPAPAREAGSYPATTAAEDPCASEQSQVLVTVLLAVAGVLLILWGLGVVS